MSDAQAPIVETFPVGPLQCNCTILGDPATGRALVIDPGWDAEAILERLRAHDLEVAGLLHTHAHIDHINGTLGVHEALGGHACLHEEDLPLYEGIEAQASVLMAFGMSVDLERDIHRPPEPERLLGGGDTVGSGAIELEVLHTPGHTPGSLSFVLSKGDRPLVFSGDTLFAGGVGRTDLWGGDFSTLRDSIATKLYGLEADTLVVPGHGPTTTIDRERRNNPFVSM